MGTAENDKLCKLYTHGLFFVFSFCRKVFGKWKIQKKKLKLLPTIRMSLTVAQLVMSLSISSNFHFIRNFARWALIHFHLHLLVLLCAVPLESNWLLVRLINLLITFLLHNTPEVHLIICLWAFHQIIYVCNFLKQNERETQPANFFLSSPYISTYMNTKHYLHLSVLHQLSAVSIIRSLCSLYIMLPYYLFTLRLLHFKAFLLKKFKGTRKGTRIVLFLLKFDCKGKCTPHFNK